MDGKKNLLSLKHAIMFVLLLLNTRHQCRLSNIYHHHHHHNYLKMLRRHFQVRPFAPNYPNSLASPRKRDIRSALVLRFRRMIYVVPYRNAWNGNFKLIKYMRFFFLYLYFGFHLFTHVCGNVCDGGGSLFLLCSCICPYLCLCHQGRSLCSWRGIETFCRGRMSSFPCICLLLG